MKGYFRKKENQPVPGVKVPETKMIQTKWGPFELRTGGYLMKGDDGENYYGINPESFEWGYEVVEKDND